MTVRCLLTFVVYLTLVSPALSHHVRYTADLTGFGELPANISTGQGKVVLTFDLDLAVMEIETSFDGLLGDVTSAHIHAATNAMGSGIADVATQLPTFDLFPTGANVGSYEHEFALADAATYNPDFILASGGTVSTAMLALFGALDQGKAYFDIHTTAYNDGEIRGFLSHVEGDYNLNGVVDAADYVVWRKTLGEIGDGLVADASENSVIDTDDFDAWRNNFGAAGLSFAPASGTVVSAAIPEPTSVVLTLLATGVVIVSRWRAPF